MLRVIEVPKELNEGSQLIPKTSLRQEEADSDSESDEEEVHEEEEEDGAKASSVGKRKAPSSNITKKKNRRTENAILDRRSHMKLLGKAWVTLLSFPLTDAMHKLVLKHLPDHVIPNMSRPILLADYLTQCYTLGGVLAVLALESLFQLIANYNLDYPHFFESLYKLCSIEVFSAKYRVKFLKLLSTALKSSNLPAYVAAAFIKRLMHLALHAPTYTCNFCVAQIFRLLQSHPQCMALIHRTDGDTTLMDYNAYEVMDLENCHATQSSLWEVEALLNHYHHSVSDFVHKFKMKVSNANDIRKTVLANPEEFININFPDMISDELSALKRNEALGFLKPSRLIPEGSIVDKCFK